MHRHLMQLSKKSIGNYFFLNRQYILKKGIDGFALYDLFTGDLIAVNSEIGNVLHLAESGPRLDEIAANLSKDIGKVNEILNDVAKRKIGDFYNNRVYIEKFKKGTPIYSLFSTIFPPVIYRCFIELPGECSQNCSYCNSPILNWCSTCSKATGMLNYSKLKKFLERLLQIELKRLIFHGSDPLTNLEQLISYVELCRNLGFGGEICVITNGNLITEGIIHIFKYYGVSPIITVFPIAGKNINPTVENHLKHFAEVAHQQNVDFSITLMLLPNISNILPIETFVKSLVPTSITKALILNSTQKINIPASLGKLVARVNADVFYHNTEHHPCLFGTIAISSNGDVLPCPHLKTTVLGNINTDQILDHIFENNIIDEFWDFSLSNVEKCAHCEFQFGCLDCRAVEVILTGDLHGKKICTLKAK